MEQNTNNVPTQQTTSDKNLRRRTAYAEMSPERKQSFLSQLRAKRAELKKKNILQQSNSTTALTITPSSLAPQQVVTCTATNAPCASTTTEHTVSCSSTFKLWVHKIEIMCLLSNKLSIEICPDVLDMRKCHQREKNYFIPKRKSGQSKDKTSFDQIQPLLLRYHFFILSSAMLATHTLFFLLLNLSCKYDQLHYMSSLLPNYLQHILQIKVCFFLPKSLQTMSFSLYI
ncbi:hypothetical protein H5410_030312 [Solanum commersonii]|uniref:Uncharacterized protein n=1 Tax=Solanum commersonii TaxID=4109 RepID=A0A9J5YIZ1_SOLCO|nr:hypothetical protein H5410_030312 [Solanum commersonii]